MNHRQIVLAGATGNLGHRICRALLEQHADVVALVRKETDPRKAQGPRQLGAEVRFVDFQSRREMIDACQGAACVVSAVSGLRETIVDLQSNLLAAAVAAGVPRFIPSDFAADFTKLSPGENRNFDLRREFHAILEQAPIRATSILNGAFADMLGSQAPIVLFKWQKILYWENPDQRLDFTTMENTAQFTAAAALDPAAPRFLRIAGDEISARELADVMTELTGQDYELLRAGGRTRLRRLIRVLRALSFSRKAVFPVWQGLQYLENMFSGRAKLKGLDNNRYGGIRWSSARDVLGRHVNQARLAPSPT